MEIITLKRSNKEQIYKLAIEENKIFEKYTPQPIYRVKFTKKVFGKLFRNNFGENKVFFGIRENHKIIAILSGYIKPAPRGNVGYIDNLFVSKKYSGRGYATILKNKFFQWLENRKIKYCQLDVLAKNPAKQIYEKWGFALDGFRMTKKL
jgi:GNAT superfamily N-acetyltransferase